MARIARTSELNTSKTLERRALFRKLEELIVAKVGRPFGDFDRKFLELTLMAVEGLYDHESGKARSPSTLHNIRGPLADVIKTLKRSENIVEILIGFGASASIRSPPVMQILTSSGSSDACDRALSNLRSLSEAPGGGGNVVPRLALAWSDDQGPADRYEALVRDLERIAAIVPPDPPKPGRGRPKTTQDLLVAVQLLSDYWTKATGTEFAVDWEKGRPFNDPARFVVEIVKFIAPNRLRSLPRLTSKIVKGRQFRKRPERQRAKSQHLRGKAKT